MTATAEINFQTTNFVRECFQELEVSGFDFGTMRALRAVISPDNLISLQRQVTELKGLPDDVRADIPCLTVLKDFIHLVKYLKDLSRNPSKELDARGRVVIQNNDDKYGKT